MVSLPADENPSRFEVRVTSDSHFSWVRTRLSVERTMMSWIRTAISLIGFGFTIFQFFEHLGSMAGVAPALRPQMPRYIGLALIGAGILALAISLWQYHWGVRYLWSEPYRPIAGVRVHEMQTPVMALTVLLMLIGLVAFSAIVVRAV
jgi:putative membrane protein